MPFFVVDGRYGVSGAQSPEVLLQVLQQAWDDRPALVRVGATTGAATGATAGADEPGCGGDACAV